MSKMLCKWYMVDIGFETKECYIAFLCLDGYTIDEVELRWRKEDPIQNNTQIKLPEFTLMNISQDNCTISYTTGIVGEMYILKSYIDIKSVYTLLNANQKRKSISLDTLSLHQ